MKDKSSAATCKLVIVPGLLPRQERIETERKMLVKSQKKALFMLIFCTYQDQSYFYT